MVKTIISLLFLIFFSILIQAQDQIPNVVRGEIDRIEHFQSKYITARNVDIWLPAGYSDTIKYAVLYMHDGQMLYDAESTWNKQSWDVDDVATLLFETTEIKKFIVVGIWNNRQSRHTDYFPQKPYEYLTVVGKDTISTELQTSGAIKKIFRPESDNYLKFIVNELKPYIDKNYTVFTDRENTFIAGSSMGGLISMYAICEYPEIFGGAACLSTHWIGTFNLDNKNPIPNAFVNYLSKNLPSPESHKIYFDCGDKTLDAMYPPIQQKVDRVMILKGFTEENWMTKYFPGENHSEKSWNKRLDVPLVFLFKNN